MEKSLTLRKCSHFLVNTATRGDAPYTKQPGKAFCTTFWSRTTHVPLAAAAFLQEGRGLTNSRPGYLMALQPTLQVGQRGDLDSGQPRWRTLSGARFMAVEHATLKMESNKRIQD